MRSSRNRNKSKKSTTSKPPAEAPLIRVQLDARTTITIRRMEMLKFWKERYPEAKVI